MDSKSNSWRALRVRARFERVVTTNLSSRGIEVFLPSYVVRRQRGGRSRSIELPLFPGYLFCRTNESSRRNVVMAPGALYVVDSDVVQESVVEKELAAIQTLVQSSLHYEAGPAVTTGVKVQVLEGPLTNVRAFYVSSENSRHRIALGVSLLHRSVLVDLAKGTEIVPVFRSGLASISVPA